FDQSATLAGAYQQKGPRLIIFKPCSSLFSYTMLFTPVSNTMLFTPVSAKPRNREFKEDQ
ncbi:MAG: hypothetical protein LC775_09780, partial [Acidobacteria bacterium]|nr:hypothetical protein [Acidobacteriota bacterium]